MKELTKAYDFIKVEQRLYKWWEESGFFKPWNEPQNADFNPNIAPYVISYPPTNITGSLHLGHVMVVAMEDMMVRHQRMKGIPTLWVPGTDHAGIATQLQVEKMLLSQGRSREALGRERFEQEVWLWKEKYGSQITEEIRRLGASCDWRRERFTLDEGLSIAVREAFVRLYEKGLIYRGPRMTNWSPGLQTAVSDLEVEYFEEPGVLYYFKYRLADDPSQFIPVATTRPETILGDTAVAVHPDDERYQQFIGKTVLVPILDREIPVIADEYVDRKFGTGALKITPAHDPNDYEIGVRHNLEIITILDKGAVINQNGGPYQGLERFECRKKIWQDMAEKGLTIKEQPYTHQVPRSQRGGEIIEPMITTQWYIKMKPLAEAGLKAVRDGEIIIIPERFTKVYYNWLENVQDWCISRQLWWGHRIPVWYCDECEHLTVAREDPAVCSHCGSIKIHQETDVLDTWFSSGLWPFSTLGWPAKTPDLEYFYPTTMLETGYDILFFWVARMIMMGLEFTGEVPFKTVYLHGLIRDEFGVKMSKTKGNVIAPLPVMEELGTDALRFSLLVGSTPGNDMSLSLKKVEANRNFANKIWNAGRFIISNLERVPDAALSTSTPTLADTWVLARLQQVNLDVDRLFENYQYGEAGRQIYEFIWNEFADWYVEIAKSQLNQGGDRAFYTAQTLVYVFDTCLRLLHPFTPFVTEELWQSLKEACSAIPDLYQPESGWEKALMIAKWPQPRQSEGWEDDKVNAFILIQEIVRAIRNLRTENKLPHGKKIAAILVSENLANLLIAEKEPIALLAGLDLNRYVVLPKLSEKPQDATPLVVGGVEIYLSLAEFIDSEHEVERLEKEMHEINIQIERLEKLLASSFAEKAPPAVVTKEREKLETFRNSFEKIKEQRRALE